MEVTAIGYLLGVIGGMVLGGTVAWALSTRRKSMEFQEFKEIRNEGFNDGVDAAAELLERFASISNDEKGTLRHAELIRKLHQDSS